MKKEIDKIVDAVSTIVTVVAKVKKIVGENKNIAIAQEVVENAARIALTEEENAPKKEFNSKGLLPIPEEAKIEAKVADSFFEGDAERSILEFFTTINEQLRAIIPLNFYLKYGSTKYALFAEDAFDRTDPKVEEVLADKRPITEKAKDLLKEEKNQLKKPPVWDQAKDDLRPLLDLSLNRDGGLQFISESMKSMRRFLPGSDKYMGSLGIDDLVNLFRRLNNSRTGAANAKLEEVFAQCEKLVEMAKIVFNAKPKMFDLEPNKTRTRQKVYERIEKAAADLELSELVKLPVGIEPIYIPKGLVPEGEEEKKEKTGHHIFLFVEDLLERKFQIRVPLPAPAKGHGYALNRDTIEPRMKQEFTELDKNGGHLTALVQDYPKEAPLIPKQQGDEEVMDEDEKDPLVSKPDAIKKWEKALAATDPTAIDVGLNHLRELIEASDDSYSSNSLSTQYAILIPLAIKACHPGLSDDKNQDQVKIKREALMELAKQCELLPNHTRLLIKILRQAHPLFTAEPEQPEIEYKIAQLYHELDKADKLDTGAQLKALEEWLRAKTSPSRFEYPLLVRLIIQSKIQSTPLTDLGNVKKKARYKDQKNDFLFQFIKGACVLVFTYDADQLPQKDYVELINRVIKKMGETPEEFEKYGLDRLSGEHGKALRNLFITLRDDRFNPEALSALAAIYFPSKPKEQKEEKEEKAASNNNANDQKGPIDPNFKAAIVLYKFLAQSENPNHSLPALQQLATIAQRPSVLDVEPNNLQTPIFYLTQLVFAAKAASLTAMDGDRSSVHKFVNFATKAAGQLSDLHEAFALIARLYSQPDLKDKDLIETINRLWEISQNSLTIETTDKGQEFSKFHTTFLTLTGAQYSQLLTEELSIDDYKTIVKKKP